MSHCFVLGSSRDGDRTHQLRVLHSIEYLTYDLKAHTVQVWGDFFVENLSDAPARLFGLHPGSIRFELATAGWLGDERWTPVLREIAGKAIGLRTTGQGKVFLREAGASALEVDISTAGGLEYWTPEPAENGPFVCFTGWQSPDLPARKCSLVRIVGGFSGETYEHLMPEPGSEAPVRIMGGQPLQTEIRKALKAGGPETAGLEEAYDKFEEEYHVEPQFYHIFFERLNGNSFKPVGISTGVRVRKENVSVHGRRVSWVWSDSDFNAYAKANGPVLELVER